MIFAVMNPCYSYIDLKQSDPDTAEYCQLDVSYKTHKAARSRLKQLAIHITSASWKMYSRSFAGVGDMNYTLLKVSRSAKCWHCIWQFVSGPIGLTMSRTLRMHLSKITVARHTCLTAALSQSALSCSRTSSSGGYAVRSSHDSDGMQAASQVPEVIGDELPPTLLEVCYAHSVMC